MTEMAFLARMTNFLKELTSLEGYVEIEIALVVDDDTNQPAVLVRLGPDAAGSIIPVDEARMLVKVLGRAIGDEEAVESAKSLSEAIQNAIDFYDVQGTGITSTRAH